MTTTDIPQVVSPWSVSNEDLAHNIAMGLRNLAAMIATHPEVAPLWAGMFRNLINPVFDADRMDGLIETLTVSGASVTASARFGGFDVRFGPAVQVLVLTGAQPLVAPVAENFPEPPADGDESADAADEPTQALPVVTSA